MLNYHCLHCLPIFLLLASVFCTADNTNINTAPAQHGCTWCSRSGRVREIGHFQRAICSSEFVLHGTVIDRSLSLVDGRLEFLLHFDNVTFLKPGINELSDLMAGPSANKITVRMRAANQLDFNLNTTYIVGGDFLQPQRQLLACDCAIRRLTPDTRGPDLSEQRFAVAKRWADSCQMGCSVRSVVPKAGSEQLNHNVCRWDPDIHGHGCYKDFAVCWPSETTALSCEWRVVDTINRLWNISTITQGKRFVARNNERLCKLLSEKT